MKINSLEEAKIILRDHRIGALAEKSLVSIIGGGFAVAALGGVTAGISYLMGGENVARYSLTIGCFGGLVSMISTLFPFIPYCMTKTTTNGLELHMDHYDEARNYIQKQEKRHC